MTYIIAEAGTGHCDLNVIAREGRARKFIKEAAKAGADAVKFQMFVADEPLFCPLPGDDERMERWNGTELNIHDWRRLKLIAEREGIDLLWSVFQPTCVEWLKELKPKYIKVASRSVLRFPYDALPGPFLVSGFAIFPTYHPVQNFHHLKCCAEYPAPLDKCGFDARYAGLSDHSGTIWPGLDAIAHGAKFLEVHFKIPSADMGNDRRVCLSTDQLRLLCEARDAFAKMHQD
jgi:N-acetylneuraminate synthase